MRSIAKPITRRLGMPCSEELGDAVFSAWKMSAVLRRASRRSAASTCRRQQHGIRLFKRKKRMKGTQTHHGPQRRRSGELRGAMIMPRNVFSDFSRNIFRPASTCRRQQHGVSLTKRKKAEGMAVKLTVEPSRGGGASVVGAAVSQRRDLPYLTSCNLPGQLPSIPVHLSPGGGSLVRTDCSRRRNEWNAAVGESF
ncbi:hypothetical protein CLOM_g12654 [Closterium sp. NIES-68]|nr:hypothetical protein CLOM_g12654 [Closterium sp. NIES-68]